MVWIVWCGAGQRYLVCQEGEKADDGVPSDAHSCRGGGWQKGGEGEGRRGEGREETGNTELRARLGASDASPIQTSACTKQPAEMRSSSLSAWQAEALGGKSNEKGGSSHWHFCFLSG